MNAINEKYVLKDSMIINQQKSKIVLKYKETSEKIYTSNHDQKSQHLKNGQEGKENTNFISDKKVKLKLKTFSSKQLLVKQPLIEDIKKVKQQKINQLNSVPKSSKSHKQNYNSQKSKQSKINSYFKPSVIFFSLKTNKESEKTKTQSNQLLSEPNTNENLKETKIKKNYSLAAFISQFVHKINQILSSNVSNESIEYSFSYSQFIEILNSLSMVRYSSQIVYKIDIEDQKEELQKVYLLWRIFKANLISSSTSSIKNRRYFLINFIILLAAILRLNVQNVEQLNEIFVEKLNILSQKRDQSKEVLKNEYSQSEPSHIFFVKNKKLLNPQPKITYQGIHFIDLNDLIKNEIFKQFQLFRINRLNTHTLTTMPKQEFAIHGQALEFDLGSFLSPKSQQLAQTKRLKILQEIRKSQPQDNSNKQKFIQNDLNLFLTYKSPRSCENRLMKNYQEQLSENKKQKIVQSKQKVNKKQILDVKSPKIKFSQLNVVLNMQKGRKLKQQKQMILQKGWTNNGHLYSIVSNQKQHKDAKVSMKNEKQCNSLNQRSSNNKKSLTNSIHKNFFESRKNSFRGMKILQQKMKNQQKVQQNEERLNNYEQLFLCDDDYQNEYEVKRQIIEPLDDISNSSTIPIKDNHQCFDDLQGEDDDDEEQREFYQQQDQEHDLIIKNHFQLQNDLKSKQLLLLKTQQNTRTQTQSFQKINSNEQQIDDFNFKSKTFNTQQNQFLEEDSSTNLHNQTQRLSKQTQTRVIKSYLKIPILYVDVNMDDSKKQRIIIYQEDNPTDLAKQFGQKHKLGIQMVQRLQEMLKEQIGGILGRIDEEDDQNDETHGQIDHY